LAAIEVPKRPEKGPSVQTQNSPSPRLPLPIPYATDSARYAAIRARDASAEGHFFYSVATTGVYCRPSCAARPPLRQNVAFHGTSDEAEAAGFRPCKRCRPRELSQLDRHARVVAATCTLIESSGTRVGLKALAASAGLGPHHLHRLFKRHMGMTPRQYAATYRLQKVSDELRRGSTVTAAIGEAGYSSSSRFYEADSGALGVLPSNLRRGAKDIEIRATVRACSLGHILVAATSRGVCAISFGDEAAALFDDLNERFPRARVQPCDPALDAIAVRIVRMVDSSDFAKTIPLHLMGTAFQQRVWRALRAIPRGGTVTYAQIANTIGAPRAVRAVGSACGKNPVAGAIPCHRVVRSDGGLGGYRWGLDRKRALLDRERSK
jgi:AraC family transcriptional regulator of adaptative response/methylated-DNA-[protein]-cysteine methyltransferase